MKKSHLKHGTLKPSSIVFALALFFTPISGFTQILDFNFTAVFTIVTADGAFLANTSELGNSTDGNRTPVEGTMQYNSSNGAANFTITPFFLNGSVTTWEGLTMEDIGSNLRLFNASFDWNGNFGIPVSLVWDATGLINAVNTGLSNGSVVNGSLGGAIPATSNTVENNGPFGNVTYPLGPSPLATTTFDTTPVAPPVVFGYNPSGQLPIINDLVIDATNGDIGIGGSPQQTSPFLASNINIDFNTLEVTNISATPIPPALWLFSTGLIGLLSMAARKKTT